MSGVFAGVRVVEIGGGEAGAYCAKLFADFGAEVIKIEPPGGDPMRTEGLCVEAGPGLSQSALFAWFNTNKKSVIADDAERIAALAAKADVLIDSRLGAVSDPGPSGHAALRAANPALTIVAISWFGETGPYRDFAAVDATVRALAGCVKVIGPVEEPAVQGEGQAFLPAALSAFTAAASALTGGGGRAFEVSIQEANLVTAEYQVANVEQLQEDMRRRGVNRAYPTFPLGVYRCREGWLGVSIVTPNQWRDFCDMLDLGEIVDAPEYQVLSDRFFRAEALEALYAPKFLARTAAEWFADAKARNLPIVVCPDMATLLATPAHREHDAFAEVCIGSARFEGPAVPQHLTATPPLRAGRAPLAGEDASRWTGARAAPVQVRDAETLPLAGLRVVDLTMGWAGTLATRQIADLGAEVIKVEARAYPDWWRASDYSPQALADQVHERPLGFQMVNRHKLGVTLDLTHPDGAALLKRLVAEADAVAENYAGGVLAKLGLGWEDLRAVNPRLVMLSMPAYGPNTEWGVLRAYGSTLEHGSGLPLLTGRDPWPPTMNHVAYGDPIGGLNGAAALALGLMHQRRTGEGQLIDMSQVEAMLPLVAPWIIEQSVTGATTPRRGARHSRLVPHGLFRCAGEDSWIAIAAQDDAAWSRLARLLGREDLAALATAEARRAEEDAIEAALGAWTADRDEDEAMAALQAAGVAAGVARGYFDLLWREPQLEARGFWQWIDRDVVGFHPQPTAAFREEGEGYAIRAPAPTLGQHGREVLARILGLDDAALDDLEARQIIGTEPIAMADRQPRSAARALAARQG